MAIRSALITVAEFVRLADPAGGARLELRHGEVIESPPVQKRHTAVQKHLVELLTARVDPRRYGVVKEIPFRPTSEYEVWTADVAVYSLAIWEQTPDDDYYRAVPVIVIEVLSPSNTASEMIDREALCLQNGGREFWLVDPQKQRVKVTRAGGDSTVFDLTAELTSDVLLAAVPVREIFS
ncbi:MAG: Uma2 family endonuclease [Bryobacteraceae bacterium]|nr:Uma2 family endonuclease [Bryobacteraceae bacterium]